MLLADLMEKSEAGQVAILSYLLQGSPVSISDLQAETELSKATLLKYIMLINDRCYQDQEPELILLAGDQVSLNHSSYRNPQFLLASYARESIKFQILLSLLYQERFLAHQLAQELAISEATLNRHLATLNTLLAEFDFGIQNGRLKGPEHQIRYFYFLLLRQTWSQKDWQEAVQSVSRQREIRVLEELAGGQLSKGQTLDWVLWAHISQHRLQVQGCQFDVLEDKLSFYYENRFCHRLGMEIDQFFAGKHLMSGGEESEVLLVFAFLNAYGILPLHTQEYILGFGGPIADLTTDLIQKMKALGYFDEQVDGQVTNQLSQLCALSYTFQGRFSMMLISTSFQIRHLS